MAPEDLSMSDNARQARCKADWSRVGMARLLSVFEHLAKFTSESVAKTNSPLGQARHNKTHNTLAPNGLWILVRALAQDLPLFLAREVCGGAAMCCADPMQKQWTTCYEKNRSNY
jgi:hypothetical protein